MRQALIAAMLSGTAACATAGGADRDRAATGGQADPTIACDTATVQRFIGMTYQEALGARIREQAGARSVRVLRPGEPATMDYRSDRLNIDLDAQGRISTLRCG